MRVQFGRPIGQFQAVKHALADMLVSVEQCAAVAWDAAAAWSEDGHDADRDLSARIAGAVALDAAAHCAKQCIQILGGIGFTWEHDAHLYLKRAMANLQLVAGGDVGALEHEVTALAVGGARRNLAADLPPEAEALRDEIRAVVADVAAVGAAGGDQRAALAEAGLIMPHWPPPWGRGASPLEQLVIDEELAAAAVPRPHLAVGAWALPTLIAHGTAEQQERWVRPTLLGHAELVPALQRARCGLRPGRPQHEGGARRGRLGAQRAEGLDVAGPDGRLRHLPRPLGSRRAQARRHHLLHRRHARRGHRHPAAARAHRRRHVQRGLLQRRVRARRRGGGHPGRRLADRPHDAGQRARLHVVGRVLRQRGGVAHPERGAAAASAARRARRASSSAWAT